MPDGGNVSARAGRPAKKPWSKPVIFALDAVAGVRSGAKVPPWCGTTETDVDDGPHYTYQPGSVIGCTATQLQGDQPS